MYLTHRQDDNVLVRHGSKDGTQNGGWTFQPQLFLTLKGFQMAHQTPSSSLKKHPRSLRLILAELFSGRVSARLSELEEKVGQMEHRLDDHAVAISNRGSAMGK
ncbi:hypothetical protein BANRA_05218 [Klebsiella pneumoniae]|nr:hypothetical protein BANRA_05218 [Klebsiella pneumoniae]